MTFYYQWAPKDSKNWTNEVPNQKLFDKIEEAFIGFAPTLRVISENEKRIFPVRKLQNLIYPTVEKAYVPMSKGCIPLEFDLYQVCEIEQSDAIDEAKFRPRHISFFNIYELSLIHEVQTEAYWLTQGRRSQTQEIITQRLIRYVCKV